MISDVWAAVPVKEFAGAKQRLSPLLTVEQRRALAAAMLEDVLAALAAAPLAGIMVNTLDPLASELARRYDARVVTDGARDGHTGAVAAMARILADEGRAAMLAVPGDIPRATAAEIAAVVAARRPAPSLTIVPAHDERGSNAVLCSPPIHPQRRHVPGFMASLGRGASILTGAVGRFADVGERSAHILAEDPIMDVGSE